MKEKHVASGTSVLLPNLIKSVFIDANNLHVHLVQSRLNKRDGMKAYEAPSCTVEINCFGLVQEWKFSTLHGLAESTCFRFNMTLECSESVQMKRILNFKKAAACSHLRPLAAAQVAASGCSSGCASGCSSGCKWLRKWLLKWLRKRLLQWLQVAALLAASGCALKWLPVAACVDCRW